MSINPEYLEEHWGLGRARPPKVATSTLTTSSPGFVTIGGFSIPAPGGANGVELFEVAASFVLNNTAGVPANYSVRVYSGPNGNTSDPVVFDAANIRYDINNNLVSMAGVVFAPNAGEIITVAVGSSAAWQVLADGKMMVR